MTESRLQRWSRRKRDAAKPDEPATPTPTPETPAQPQVSAEEQELAINEALPEQEVLAKYGLPDPDAIELGTDITGFLRKEIPEMLRRRALRALWRSNPVLAVLDGLNDYDEDYTDAGLATKGAKTLYKVGQGFLDRSKRDAEKAAALEAEPQHIEAVAPPAEPEVSPEVSPEPAEPATDTPVLNNDDNRPEPVTTVTTWEPVEQEPASTPEPRYRPRMYFDT
jgi:hypothetical protein